MSDWRFLKSSGGTNSVERSALAEEDRRNDGLALCYRLPNIRMTKIITLPQHRLALLPR
jgi:hypothetical protein